MNNGLRRLALHFKVMPQLHYVSFEAYTVLLGVSYLLYLRKSSHTSSYSIKMMREPAVEVSTSN